MGSPQQLLPKGPASAQTLGLTSLLNSARRQVKLHMRVVSMFSQIPDAHIILACMERKFILNLQSRILEEEKLIPRGFSISVQVHCLALASRAETKKIDRSGKGGEGRKDGFTASAKPGFDADELA